MPAEAGIQLRRCLAAAIQQVLEQATRSSDPEARLDPRPRRG